MIKNTICTSTIFKLLDGPWPHLTILCARWACKVCCVHFRTGVSASIVHIYTYIHTYAYAYISTRMRMRIYDTVQTHWRTATETHNLCINMHTHTHTHVYTCIRIHIHIHMHIHTYIHVSTHKCMHIYTHTHVQHIPMHARKHVWNDGAAATARAARLDATSSALLPIQSGGGLPSVASSHIARARGTTDKCRTFTNNSTSSHHHDRALPRLQPLLCTGTEPVHPVHGPSKLRDEEVMILPFSRVFPQPAKNSVFRPAHLFWPLHLLWYQ